MKKLRKILTLVLTFSIVFISNSVFAEGYMKENSFVNATGADRIHEIKRFQALNNLNVTGVFNQETKNMLYNPDLKGYDGVKNPPTSGRWVVINKSKKILTVYNGIYPDVKFPVTLGTSNTPTPSAKGTVMNLYKNPAWNGMGGKYTPRAADDPLNPLGERWIGLNIPGRSGYGIHGTIRPMEIGKYTSNGCIRLFNYDVENYVFPKMKVGMPVWIGTDQELANWGVHQYVDKISNNVVEKPVEEKKETTEKKEEKPVEKKEEPRKAVITTIPSDGE